MARVVNLNHARKARDRAQKRRQADDNAAFHGLSKAQKDLARARSDKARRDHAGHTAAHDTRDVDGSQGDTDDPR